MNGLLSNSHTFGSLFETFRSSHESQLNSIALSENKWRTLFIKLQNSVFDAGNDFMYAQEEDDSSEDGSDEPSEKPPLRVYTKCSMEPDDENHIYLIDHAWTYTLEKARKVLEDNSNLVERMCSIMNLSGSNDSIDTILKEMWKYNNSYILQNPLEIASFTRCWFIMDEFGSRIRHCEEPTFALVHFFYTGDNMMYSLIFPKVSVSEGEEVTYVYPRYGSTLSDEMQKALKFPWVPCDLTDLDFSQPEPDIEYFKSGRIIEVLPDGVFEVPSLVNERKIKVYSQYSDVSEHLFNPRFSFTNDKKKAHILWLAERLFDYKTLADSREDLFYINQFPSEQVLINKDLLAIVSRRSDGDLNCSSNDMESRPRWLPTTYSLMLELPKFISYFQNREKRGLDNTWICKPFNLARGLDIYITDNLCEIIRFSEIRPMVACKYLIDSVLFPKENVGLVKMDLRFIVLLKNVQDLELFVYESFWIRFANKPFSMDDFQDYEKHFTVMNYGEYPLQQMFCHDFIRQFEDYYSSYEWSDIEKKIYKMIKEIFTAAAMKGAPAGFGIYPGSRAMYGLDIMLEWDRNYDVPQINPVILEVNWMPDCKRACQYYPEYYDDVFSVLFLNTVEGKHVVQL